MTGLSAIASQIGSNGWTKKRRPLKRRKNIAMDKATNSLSVIPAAFQALILYRQWVLWIISEGRKIPINPNTYLPASVNDPNTWSDFDTAIKAAKSSHKYRVGFVLTDNDPFFFIDIDHCLSPSGKLSDTAKDIVNRLAGAAVEVSQSGEGLHIVGSYSGTFPDHSCKNTKLGLELYHKERFIALASIKL